MTRPPPQKEEEGSHSAAGLAVLAGFSNIRRWENTIFLCTWIPRL